MSLSNDFSTPLPYPARMSLGDCLRMAKDAGLIEDLEQNQYHNGHE